MIMYYLKLLKRMLWKDDEHEYEDGPKYKLNRRITIRLNDKELKLIESYCDLRGIDISSYFRNLNMYYIDMFIQDNS